MHRRLVSATDSSSRRSDTLVRKWHRLASCAKRNVQRRGSRFVARLVGQRTGVVMLNIGLLAPYLLCGP